MSKNNIQLATFYADPDQICEMLKEASSVSDVEITEDRHGDPLIRFKIMEKSNLIAFYSKDDEGVYRSVQFGAAFKNQGQYDLETINQLNRKRRFVRYYLDKDDDLIMEMDLTLKANVTPDYFREIIDLWCISFLGFLFRNIDNVDD